MKVEFKNKTKYFWEHSQRIALAKLNCVTLYTVSYLGGNVACMEGVRNLVGKTGRKRSTRKT
jgi:hypothetical protein